MTENYLNCSCPNCGTKFHVRPSHVAKTVFCGRACQRQFSRDNAPTVINKCLYCSKEFSIPRHQRNRKKCCSIECARRSSALKLATPIIEKQCPVCGETFQTKSGCLEKKCCSRKCGYSGNGSYKKISIKVPIACQFCQNEIMVNPGAVKYRKFCSRDCNNKAQIKDLALGSRKSRTIPNPTLSAKRKPRPKCICILCGNEFLGHNQTAYKNIFCGSQCQDRYRQVDKTCKQCEKPFTVKRCAAAETFFCCRKCYGKWKSINQRGSKSLLWRGGMTNLRKRLGGLPEYKEWRMEVFRRDHFTCQHCGVKHKIRAHHIKPVSTHIELVFSVENGLTLCLPCHNAVHKEMGSLHGKSRVAEFFKDYDRNN